MITIEARELADKIRRDMTEPMAGLVTIARECLDDPAFGLAGAMTVISRGLSANPEKVHSIALVGIILLAEIANDKESSDARA